LGIAAVLIAIIPGWKLNNRNFLNELGEILKLGILLYADDTMILADSQNELQKGLDALGKYCDKWKLKVNSSKTALVTINPSHQYAIDAYLSDPDSDKRIIASEEVKLVGFVFSGRPSVHAQVNSLVERCSRRLWLLRKLKNARVRNEDIATIYKSLLRSILEYSAPVYHSMLTQGLSNRLERVQKQALRIMFGFDTPYEEMCNLADTITLHARRTKLVHDFAHSLIGSRFEEMWLPRIRNTLYDLRTTLKFKEFHARTSRLYDSPLYYFRRLLNQPLDA